MLNYLGPELGGRGPVVAGLPESVPGTMPDGVPGLPPTPSPIAPRAEPSPDAMAAISARAPNPMAAPPAPPPPPEYAAVTQEDGSILLHIKNADGSLGPAVKVIPPIKRPGDKAQGQT